jgi:transcriptional regulator with XRE-family HTH domain
MTALQRRIRELREERGWSQDHVARALCLRSKTTVSKWENGVASPQAATIARLAELFGVSMSELYGEAA